MSLNGAVRIEPDLAELRPAGERSEPLLGHRGRFVRHQYLEFEFLFDYRANRGSAGGVARADGSHPESRSWHGGDDELVQ